MFELRPTRAFAKNRSKLSRKHQEAVDKKLFILAKDPHYPSLRTKKYKSEDGVWESSVNMSIRILWRYEGDKIILLNNVGHHDIL